MIRKNQKTVKFRFGLTSVAVAAILSCLPHASRAAPLSGVVASGGATISTSGAITTINQSTDRAVIDWTSFNLSQEETARFIVPSESGATLNRISGGASTISGTVESNGTVYFSNPNGLVFDATSRVSANGFLATTGTVSNFDFMNRGDFSKPTNSTVTLNGAISAAAITARAGTVAVGGNLSAGSGKIVLSSTNLTTIGSGAVISADVGTCLAADCAAVPAGATGGLNAGGKITIWSDNHTDFLGRITAVAGFVEVSGKNTLNFSGRVSTLGANGKAGTLLLDPLNVEVVAAVPATKVDGVSYITAANLKAALEANDVVINANSDGVSAVTHTTPTGTVGGSGILTLLADPAPVSGSFNLTLIASQIVMRSSLTLRGDLNLTSTRTSVWQNGNSVITATTLTGTAVDGFSLNGLNQITNLGAITNQNHGGILITNNLALTLNAGMIDGGKGGVFIDTNGSNLSLEGDLLVKGSYLRLDARAAGNLLGNHTITAAGMAVFLTSATTGNSASIHVGNGSFTFVTDLRTVTSRVTIDNNTDASSQTIGWGTGIGSLESGTPLGGLTVTTTGAVSTINNQGVVYGGAVQIGNIVTMDGTGSILTSTGLTTGAAVNLRWIEGAGVLVVGDGDSIFSGSIALVASGNGVLGTYNGQPNTAKSVAIISNRFSVEANLTLIQRNGIGNGDVNTQGFFISSRNLNRSVAVGGDFYAVQFGAVADPFSFNLTNAPTGDNIFVGGNMTLASVGYASGTAMELAGINIAVGGNITALQSGIINGSGTGIRNTNVNYTAGGDISLIQSGIMGNTTTDGIHLAFSKDLLLSWVAGSDANWVTLRSTQNLRVLLQKFSITRGKVRIDLGSSVMNVSTSLFPPTLGNRSTIPDNLVTLAVQGRDVYYTGLTSTTLSATEKYPLIDVGTTGSFTFVNDKRSQTAATRLDDSSLASSWGSGLGTLVSGQASPVGLKIIGNSTSSNINHQGVVYGGTVEISGITTTSAARSLRYIEGSGIGVSGASNFAGSLILVGSGAGFTTTVGGASVTAGIMVTADLMAGGALDRNSPLTLIQRGYSDGSGIEIAHATVRAGGDLSILQYGGVAQQAKGLVLAAASAQSGVSLSGGGSGNLITLKTADQGFALANFDNFSTSNGKIRIDLGSGAMVTVGAAADSNFTLKTLDQEVLFTGAASGNKASFAVRNGAFTLFRDKTSVLANVLMDNSFALADYGLSSFGGTVGERTWAGLRVTGTNDALIRGLGIKFGGTVTIDGVNGGDAANLNYIEASGIAVLNNESRFTGSLRLVSSGKGIFDTGKTYGIIVGINLSTGTANDRVSDLNLVQTGAVTGQGILINSATLIAGGAINASQTATSTVTEQAITIESSSLSSGRSLTLSQTGSSAKTGIVIQASSLTAGSDLSLLQSGTVGATYAGIDLYATGRGAIGVSLSAGLKDGWVRLITNNRNLSLSNFDNFVVKSRNLRIDSGSATVLSNIPASDIQTVYYTLKALGSNAFVTAVRAPGLVGVDQFKLDLGYGILTRISNRSADSNPFAITNTTGLADLGIDVVSFGFYAVSAKKITYGVIFGGTVTINGVTSGAARDLSYIEATGIGLVTSASQFTSPLTLVANGGGITHSGSTAGIVIATNLTVGKAGDGFNSLTLNQTGAVTGSGIWIDSATVTAGGNLSITQSGEVSGNGIGLNNSSLAAGGDLSLTEAGQVGSGKAGLKLSATGTTPATGVSFAAGNGRWLTISTASNGMELSNADNFAFNSGRVRLDLGAGRLFSTDASGSPLAPAATANSLLARDLELFYSGATSGNSARLVVTGGKFTFVNDRRSMTSAKTLDNGSTVADWGSGLGTLTSGTASPSGLTVIGANINNQGVVYGATVTISGVTTGLAGALNYIEAPALSVTGSNSFSGGLILVSSGGETSATIGGTVRTAGILLNNASLSTGAVSDRVSDLVLVQRDFSHGQGIGIVAGSTLRAGGNLTVAQLGGAQTDGLVIQASSLIAGGDLALLSYGFVGNLNMGILLSATGTGTEQGVKLTGGGVNSWLTLTSQNGNLQLNGADSFTLAGGKVRLDLWSASLVSSGSGVPSGGYSLKATDLDVYYTGAKTANSAKIVVAGGSFTFVNDRRGVAAITSAVTLSSSSPATDWGTGLSGLANNSAVGGLTVSTTGTLSTITHQGVVFAVGVVLDGISSGSAAQMLRYIEGVGVTVTNTASALSGSLVLVSSSPNPIRVGVNLTTAGSLSLRAAGLQLTSTVTTTTTGGSLRINLGSFGVFDNGSGSGFSLETAGGNLDLKAARLGNL
ncbi:MAG: filamentous hemagglutinin N-terminal domain-containing protein, partial [Alphaproteobacteria bacterium]|nr:filamentous hemagglutinin N-terminal domain-containing protein [Alphaproteobacteria bacterium]